MSLSLKNFSQTWYQQSAAEVFDALRTSERGLGGDEIAARLAAYGVNVLPEEEPVSPFRILLHQFTSPLIYILLIAGIVTLFLQEYIDSGVIFSVVLLNAVIGFIQEHKAEESVRALKKLVVPRAKVVRDGREKEIRSEELVPGDIVLLSSGTMVPADLRLIHTIELRIDESMMTGESIPVGKMTASLREENLLPGDQRNMAFMGTIAVSGRGKGIVVATGTATLLGRIAEKVRTVPELQTPLQTKLNRFAKIIGFAVLIFSTMIFLAGTMLGVNPSEMFLVAVATAVSAVPEGLPVAVTIAMAIGVTRMARRNAVIRKLPAVETLGSTTVIGSDKTGTLTKNEMTVILISTGQHTYEATGNGYDPAGEILHDGLPVAAADRKTLLELLRIGALCNESTIYEENGSFKIEGDPTEAALIVSAMKAGISIEEEKEKYRQLGIIPFESEYGYMATLHGHRGKRLILVKGAPEKILDMCTVTNAEAELDRKEITRIAAEFAREGLRVLAFASREAPADMTELTRRDIESGLTFAGLQGMIDPPRPEVITAIEGCRKAGITVVMITGDHGDTAAAIARKIGLDFAPGAILTGREIETMSDGELFDRIPRVSVFARVSPQHKTRITQQLISRGEIVAITGDGVNDAAALKAAHIGVAMGRCGTDVAREASDMVITDDNFASIFAAVEEGRVVYDNIIKVTLFLVSCGFGELVAISGTILLGMPVPYLPAQILWLNLVTNGLQDVALAFEPAERDVLNRPPRPPRERILSPLMLHQTLLMGMIMAAGTLYMFASSLKAGVPLDKARTIALTTMVFFQFYQAANCRSATQSIFRLNPLTNPLLFFSMIAAFFAQLAVIYVPAFQWIFRTVPISAGEWLKIGAITSTIVIAVELDKFLRSRKEKPRPEHG
ncbi:MAG: cation-translocating P-type ATPase [Desulfobulbaceae bacterium]